MRKACYLFVVFVFVYGLLEIGLRSVLCLTTGAGFVHPSNLIYKYYPELIPIQKADVSNTDSTLDVLILSCSVLHKDWANIVAELQACVKLPQGYSSIRIYNASGVGHGSRDNVIKYSLLRLKKFDVIIYYDAINDSRLNNCPTTVFKDDYSHYLWYDEINSIIKHQEMDFTVIPFFCDWLKIRVKSAFIKSAYIPQHYSLRPEWLVYGCDLKSVKCYQQNLIRVMEEAKSQNARFLYFTFAYYIAPDYSLKKFKDKTLDYGFCDHSRETEIWGEANNVGHFIDTINVNSREWAHPFANATHIDLNSQFPKNGSYFADVCHFTPKGIHQFAIIVCNQFNSLRANNGTK